MSAKKTTKIVLRNCLTLLLSLSVAAFTGFLSFTGVLAIYNSLYLGFGAIALSGGMEFIVYWENISQALKMLFTKNYLRDFLLAEELNKLVEENINNGNKNTFLNDYESQLNYIAQLQEANHPDDKTTLIKAEKRLKLMQKYFKRSVFATLDTADTEDLLGEVTIDRATLLSKINRRQLFLRLSWLVNVIAGICSVLVGAEVLKSAIMSLPALASIAAGSTLIASSIIGLSILGAVAYGLLIYNTVADMVKNETLKKWANDIRNFFKRREQENTWRYALRIVPATLGVSLITSIMVSATLCTAGTWWQLAKAGAYVVGNLVPFIKHASSWLRNCTVPLISATILIFNIDNAFKTVKELANSSIKESWHNIKSTYDLYRNHENNFQLFNPFRIISYAITKPFKVILFSGHLISMGAMGDKVPKVPSTLSAGDGAVAEGLEDAHYLFAKTTQKRDTEAEPDLIGGFLKVVLSPLHCLSGLWDMGFSRLNAKAEDRLSFMQALKKQFNGIGSILIPMRENKPKSPILSLGWQKIEMQMRIDKKVKKTIYKSPNKCEADAVRTEWQSKKTTKEINKYFSEQNSSMLLFKSSRQHYLNDRIQKLSKDYDCHAPSPSPV